jgi:uncharacterized phage protein gp47/JayE
MAFTPRSFPDILERMINRVVARTDLTDINDGSSLKQVLAAAAREDDDQYFQMVKLLEVFDIKTATGDDLDERAKDFNPALISRRAARKATGTVVFSRTGTTGTISIPIGTQVQVPASGSQEAITFTTTAAGQILNGFSSSSAVAIEADEAGEDGNVAGGAISGFVSKPTGVDTVTNASALTNGQEKESDDNFRDRLLAQLKALPRCHVFGLESAALAVEDTVSGKSVSYAKVIEDVFNRGNVSLYVDDGNGTAESTQAVAGETVLAAAQGGEVDLYTAQKPIKTTIAYSLLINAVLQVEGTDYEFNPAAGHFKLKPTAYPNGLTVGDVVTASYTHYDGLIQEVQKVIDGDPLDRSNYPGYRAAGVVVRVLPPSIQQQTVLVNITVLQGYTQDTVGTNVAAALQAYVNGLGIGEDVILNEMRERAMAVPGMFDCSFSSPSSNVVILDNQLARLVSGNLTVN